VNIKTPSSSKISRNPTEQGNTTLLGVDWPITRIVIDVFTTLSALKNTKAEAEIQLG